MIQHEIQQIQSSTRIHKLAYSFWGYLWNNLRVNFCIVLHGVQLSILLEIDAVPNTWSIHIILPNSGKKKPLGPNCVCQLMEDLRLRKMAKILKFQLHWTFMTMFLDPLFIQLKLAKNHSLQGKDQRNTCMPYEVCIFMKPSYPDKVY